MNQSITRRFLRHGLARAAAKRLSILSLSLLALPCLLPAQTLLHRYSFVSDASDSVGGSAWNGTIVAPNGGSPAVIANGLTLPGGGGNNNGYVALPNGILTSTTNITVECWATQNAANTWATIWDFANNGSQNFGLIPYPGNNNHNLEVAFTPHGNENDLQSSLSFPTGTEQYVAVTYNNSSLVASMYTNGAQVATLKLPDTTYAPGVIGGSPGTSQNWLGNDTYGDSQFQGTVYELRIWNGVVSQRYLSASTIAGPSVLINNLTPTSATLTAGPSVVITGTEQASMMVTLAQTGSTELAATQDATNWVSSNPNVLAVNSSGLVTGVSAGTATISAKVAGVLATSGTITVTGPQTLLHRYSFVSDASDSVGGAQWNGLIVAPGTSGTNATISHGLVLPGGGGGGYSGYVAFPAGILTNTTSVTIECWATQNAANTWAEIWNFANDGGHTTGLIPFPANNSGKIEVALQPHGNDIDMQSQVTYPNGSEQYICSTYNNYTLTGNLYDNGALIGTASYPDTSYAPGSIGGAAGTAQNWLGNDTYGDAQFQGTVYEFRIWNGALTPVYAAVAAAAGPSVVVTNLTPTLLNVTITNSTMIGAQTQQASVVGNFADASGVTVTAGVTNWTSSNPTILTVNSSGLITAQSGGTATISATVNGVTATSPTITVALTKPTAVGPASETIVLGQTANFSVSALGGQLSYQWSFNSTPILGATNATLIVTNVAFTNAGTYSVLIANNLGSTNPAAVLTVVSSLLEHRYSFVSDATDSVGGSAWKGSLVAPNGGTAATIANGLTLPGGGGGGFSGYVALPSGILTNTASVSVECWVTQNTPNGWATVWDFANNGSQNFELCPNPQRNINNLDVAITPNGGEIDTVTGSLFPSGTMQYVTFTFNSASLVGQIYTNGALAATQQYPNASYIPGTIGGAAGTSQNWLGNDTYGDSQFQGTVYEFRIWDGAVSPLYLAISAAAGPSVVVTNLTPLSVNVTVANSSMIPGQTQPASVTGNFQDASSIPVTGAATNWISSNPAVLTVDSNGVVTAVNTGSATVSTTVNGVLGTSSSITVATSLPVIVQQPLASETFLVGATATASIGVQGTPPFVYRWYFNGGTTPISTMTNNPVLTLPNVQLSAAGNYTCLVSNQYGTALSSAMALTVATPSTYDQTILQLGPVGYWPLNETSGTTAFDVIGGNNGMYTNFPSVTGSSYTLGQAGPSATDFGGNSLSALLESSIVDIPGASFNYTGPVTAVAWVQLAVGPGFDGLVGKGDSSWRTSINPSSQPGGNDGTSAANDATSTTGINDGNWHMVAYTYTGKPGQSFNGFLYVDGTLVASNSVVSAPTGDNLDVWIGGSPDYGTARLLPAAYIADVAIFNKALTSAQVTGVYNGVFVQGPESIAIQKSGSNVTLTWQSGTLLSASSVKGPWTTNSTATSPYTVPATNSQFFRLLVSP